MGKVYTVAVAALLWANTVMGQGTVLFIWHGDSNFFQASFQVYYDEIMPGTNFASDLFHSSMSVTNPLGETYHGGDATSAGSGRFIPWSLAFQLNDFQRGTEVLLNSADFAGSQYRTSGVIGEKPFSDPNYLWYERGYWSVAQIPEPSATALCILGATVFLVFCRRRT